jgi:pimeloyl-ACP methyl ester carboxylesterase
MRLRELEIDGPPHKVRVAFADWGPPDAPRTVVCVHGLTRQGRDFDALARSLVADGWRVLCPDLPGRGRSQWLDDPAAYAAPTYVMQVAALLEGLGLRAVDFVGTSLGGIVGMGLAAMPDNPIRSLVLNDIGGAIPLHAMAYIAHYIQLRPRFADLAEAEAYFREIHSGFSDLGDAEWRAMAAHSTRALPEGGYDLGYDPAIAQAFLTTVGDVELWGLYDTIKMPTLLLRGGASQLLTAETAAAMTERGPKAELVTFPGVGHAPGLTRPEQIEPIVRFLRTAPAYEASISAAASSAA